MFARRLNDPDLIAGFQPPQQGPAANRHAPDVTRGEAPFSGAFEGATAVFKVKKGEAWVLTGELLKWIADTAEPADDRPHTIATLNTQTHIGTAEGGGAHYREDEVVRIHGVNSAGDAWCMVKT